MSSCRQFISKLTHACALAYIDGVSKLSKICSIASAFWVKIFPHGISIPAALPVVANQSPAVCPLVEHLILQGTHKMHFQNERLLTSNGVLKLPVKPGFGVELDGSIREKIEIT